MHTVYWSNKWFNWSKHNCVSMCNTTNNNWLDSWTADHSFRELTSMICCRMLSTSLVSRLMPARSSWGRRAVRSTTTLWRMSCRFSCTDLSVQQICHYSKKPKQLRFHFLFEENLFWENWAFVSCINRCKRLQVRCLRGVPLSLC